MKKEELNEVREEKPKIRLHAKEILKSNKFNKYQKDLALAILGNKDYSIDEALSKLQREYK